MILHLLRLLVVSSFVSSVVAAELTKKDLQDAAIYVGRGSASGTTTDFLAAAVQDLQEYVKKMTGVELPVVTVANPQDIPSGKPAFVLGDLAVEMGAKPPVTEFREDGYAIKTNGKQLLLGGEADRGTAYAVADFLYRQGVRFYMPGPFGEDVPQRNALDISKEEIIEAPDWSDRRLWLMGGKGNKFEEVAPEVPQWFADWQRRNRVDTGNRLATGHMWASVFRSSGLTREQAFEKHPDWFVFVNGQRNPRHLNLLNEEVVDLFVRHYQKQLEGKPKDITTVLSLSPDDQVLLNHNIEAQEWLARNDITFTNLPDATDYLIQFNNRIIQKLREDYPNIRLAFYIYSNYQNAPTNVKLDPGLIPFIAPLNFSRYHALTDETKPNRTLLANIVRRWHEHGATIGWRDYSFLCPDAMMPFSRLHMTSRDIPWLYENGVRYMSLETVSNWPNLLPEYWLLTRLLWDVKTDQKAALDEFYERFYGPAGDTMRDYVNEVISIYDNLPFTAGFREFAGTAFPKERLASLRAKLDLAKQAVAEDPIRLHRVKLVETALNQADRFMAMREAVNRFDYPEASRLDTELLKAWDEDIAFDGLTNTLFVKEKWHRRFFSDNLDQIMEWLNGAEVLYVFPDEWPAQFDFTQTGELESLMHPQSRGFDLFRLKTYSSTLAEQGWEKFRGHIWYRQTFPALSAPEGKKLYVLFGGVDRFLKGWLNGKEIGEANSGRGFGPVLLELPNVDSKAENVLTVRVANTSPTELGVGGIIRPVGIIAK